MDGLTRPEGDALNAAVAETVSLIALLAVLAWAVTRPRGWPEAVAAVPAAVILIAAGAIPAAGAVAEARRLGPVIGFLAAILVLAHLCDEDGLFRACGDWMARASAGQPKPAGSRRLLAQVFLIASVTTAVLSLDATVVLLTPMVFATAARLRQGLGRDCERLEIAGRAERAVVAASARADLLIVARDGDRARLGQKSLGKTTRFVADHAACPVLLVWPGSAPDVSTIPPPPHHPSPPDR